MKVVTASTPEQQMYVKELVNKLYETIFPAFFSEEYITKLKDFNLMEVPNLKELNLIEIMEVTAAIQMISTILEELSISDEEMDQYHYAFKKNASILSKYQIDFPFQLVDFQSETSAESLPNQHSFYM